MKIVHIITRLIVGGAQENTLLSCQGQHELGHEVTLITGPAVGPEGSLLESARAAGYQVEIMDDLCRAIRPVGDYRAYKGLIKRLREIHPDVVHTHSSKAGIIGRWAARAAGVPVIIHTIHGLAFTASTNPLVNRVYQILEKRAARITTKIVCVADKMKDQSLAAGIGRPDQYVTVYSGMNVEPFVRANSTRQQIRRELNISDDQIVVGTIARLFYLKGHEDLLAHARQLCAEIPNLRFLWVGDGILRPQFEKQMQEMGLRDRFILTGMVRPDQVPAYVGAMDILVHPSRREGLARALPQGQLAGKPVITYDIDGNREGLLPDRSGILVPPFDTDRLVSAIASLAGDRDQREKMGVAGRDFAMKRFDRCVMITQLQNVYQQASQSPLLSMKGS